MIKTHKEHITIELQDELVTILNVTSRKGIVRQMLVGTYEFERWKSGTLIQKCFPDMLPEERELLISGLDEEDQKIIFTEPKEEED